MIGIAKLTEDMMRSMRVELRGTNEVKRLIAGRARIGIDDGLIDKIVFNRVEIDDLVAAGVTPSERPVVFLCRSGNRSIGAAEAATEAGIAPAYNVLDGFEGNLDENKHRGGTGWKAVGLPWKQS